MPAIDEALDALQSQMTQTRGRGGRENFGALVQALGRAYAQERQRVDLATLAAHAQPGRGFSRQMSQNADRPRPDVPPGRLVSAARSQRFEHSPVWTQGATRPQPRTTRGISSQGAVAPRRYYR